MEHSLDSMLTIVIDMNQYRATTFAIRIYLRHNVNSVNTVTVSSAGSQFKREYPAIKNYLQTKLIN
ncbi:hypothetical protein DERP_004908 [Dermatophagoides pteronyssinus]|uniref:Uncharacterized protein n=1 Tax=Dermatophagoides pteronyssinus TaxID=6956 RepID=A0ABQ8JSV3_DERPT|nr:hypothetical protein DERP_004908 [Dermatophagoides pteronyssinus]